MMTVLGHIVSKHLSQDYENIATEALAFIVASSAGASGAFVKLLLAARDGLPELRFTTQATHEDSRPDIAGVGPDSRCHVFVENKYWAGLTDAQPVRYLRVLAEQSEAGLLVVIVPDARAEAIWRELGDRVRAASASLTEIPAPAGYARLASSSFGPRLAVSTWGRVLDALALEAKNDPRATADLTQLRGLCEAADTDAILPVSTQELSDQHMPRRIIQYTQLAEAAIERAVTDRVLTTRRLNQTHGWTSIGRYARLVHPGQVGVWIGVDLALWSAHGRSPLWVRFCSGSFGRAEEVRPLLRAWGADAGRLVVDDEGDLMLALDLVPGVERAALVVTLANQFAALVPALVALPAATTTTPPDAAPLSRDRSADEPEQEK